MEISVNQHGTLHDSGMSWKIETLKEYERLLEYRDKSVAWLVPTRGMYHCKVVGAWDQQQWPMNQVRTSRIEALDMEVGEAYEYLFRLATDDEFCLSNCGPAFAAIVKRTKFILTTEDDNILPPNAVNELFASIYECIDCGELIQDEIAWTCKNGHRGVDAVSGLYWTKGDGGRPMAYGDISNPDDFRPLSVMDAIENGKTIEVNGIAQGCSLYRKASLKGLSYPWFKTSHGSTQDLFFCQKAKKELGLRFAVNCGVKVGHIDVTTGVIY